MAKRTRSIREMRDISDAAEARGTDATTPETAAPTKKKVKAKDPAEKKKPAVRAKRTKTKSIIRKRLLWVVYSSTMKEEGRYAYADREAAEARVVDLAARYKRSYFVQPLKEPLSMKATEALEQAEVVDETIEESPAG